MSGTSPQDIEADIARHRAELRSTVDVLSERLSPRNQATEALEEAKVAVADLKRRVLGDVRPAGQTDPTKKGWIVLGAGAAIALKVVTTVLRKL